MPTSGLADEMRRNNRTFQKEIAATLMIDVRELRGDEGDPEAAKLFMEEQVATNETLASIVEAHCAQTLANLMF